MADADGGAGARPGWRWDVALSFAGAQRDYVEKVAQALMARGVHCFYDADEQIELWGKYLAEELPVIYAEQAAAVVVFVFAEYAARDWTKLERRAALARAVRERREYLLPARFDDTPLPGLLSDMVSVDLRTRTPQQFAAMIADKLAALGIAAPDQSARTEPAVHIIQPPGNGDDSRKATLIIPEPVRASWPLQDRILTAALRAAPTASPRRSPTSTGRQKRWPTSRKRWRPPTPTAAHRAVDRLSVRGSLNETPRARQGGRPAVTPSHIGSPRKCPVKGG